MIDILIPTVGRSHRLARLIANIHDNTIATHRITFITEEADTDTYGTLADLSQRVLINEHTANYAGAVNTAYELTEAEWLFAGADDLVFHHRWDQHVLAMADGWATVIGTNDLLNTAVLAGLHSTHTLVHRSYLDTYGGVVDEGPGSFYPECYDHNFCDTEFINTAKMRARFRPCLQAVVEHLHVTTGKAPADETHLRSIRRYDDDSRMYDMRLHLWAGISR